MLIDKPGMEWQVFAWGYHDGRTGDLNRTENFAGNYREVYINGLKRGMEDREMLGDFIIEP